MTPDCLSYCGRGSGPLLSDMVGICLTRQKALTSSLTSSNRPASHLLPMFLLLRYFDLPTVLTVFTLARRSFYRSYWVAAYLGQRLPMPLLFCSQYTRTAARQRHGRRPKKGGQTFFSRPETAALWKKQGHPEGWPCRNSTWCVQI